MQKFTIALIGESMIELQESQCGVIGQTFGGDTLNTAIYMARFNKILPLIVDYVTALGTDHFSDAMISFWEKEGVGSSMVQNIAGELPGLYYIRLDKDGERSFHYWRSNSAARQCFDYPGGEQILDRLVDYDAIYLSGISLAILQPTSRERLLDRLVEIRARVYFDCNYRSQLWRRQDDVQEIYDRVFSLAHTVFLSVEEGSVLLNRKTAEEIHTDLDSHGVYESVVRDGKKPCSVFGNGLTEKIAALPHIRIIDSTAAGDSFGAVYILARQFGRSVHQATLLAHQMAASVIGHRGAVVPRGVMPFGGEAFLGDGKTID